MLARIAAFAAIGGFLFGYDLGLIGGALLGIRRDLGITNTSTLEAIVGGLKLGAFLGSFLGGALMLRYGRRWAIAGTCVTGVLGPLLMAAAQGPSALIIGRGVSGVGIGICAICVPTYLAEIAPAAQRGALVQVYELMLCLGTLMAVSLDLLLHMTWGPGAWRLAVALPALPGACIGLALLVLPESPRWLVMRSDLDGALAMLNRIMSATKNSKDRTATHALACAEDELLLLWSSVEKDKAAVAERQHALRARRTAGLPQRHRPQQHRLGGHDSALGEQQYVRLADVADVAGLPGAGAQPIILAVLPASAATAAGMSASAASSPRGKAAAALASRHTSSSAPGNGHLPASIELAQPRTVPPLAAACVHRHPRQASSVDMASSERGGQGWGHAAGMLGLHADTGAQDNEQQPLLPRARSSTAHPHGDHAARQLGTQTTASRQVGARLTGEQQQPPQLQHQQGVPPSPAPYLATQPTAAAHCNGHSSEAGAPPPRTRREDGVPAAPGSASASQPSSHHHLPLHHDAEAAMQLACDGSPGWAPGTSHQPNSVAHPADASPRRALDNGVHGAGPVTRMPACRSGPMNTQPAAGAAAQATRQAPGTAEDACMAQPPPPPPPPTHQPALGGAPVQYPGMAAPGFERSFAHTLWALLRDVYAVARGPERRALGVACGLAVLNQAMASTAVLNYTQTLLRQLGGMSDGQALAFGIVVAATKVASVTAGLFLVDTVGRRPLLSWGAFGCCLWLCLASLATMEGSSAAAILVSLCGFVASFSVTWAGLFWVLVSELFSMTAKSPAAAAATSLLFLSGACTNLVFLSMIAWLGPASFLVFAAIAAGSAVFVLRFVPETKGLTLGQVEVLLAMPPGR